MYVILKLKDRIRVPPSLFKEQTKKAIEEVIRKGYEGRLFHSGLLISLNKINEVGEGRIIPGDGAIYYETEFEMLAWMAELHEIVEGHVTEITEFGSFIRIGPMDGLAHISQVMDDFVSYSKTGNLSGRDSKRTLKVNDDVRARVVAVSLKSIKTAKIGLTMRQANLGKLEWLEKEREKRAKEAKKSKKEVEKKESEKKPKKEKK